MRQSYDASAVNNKRGMARRAKRRTSKQRRRQNRMMLERAIQEADHAYYDWYLEVTKRQLYLDHAT